MEGACDQVAGTLRLAECDGSCVSSSIRPRCCASVTNCLIVATLDPECALVSTLLSAVISATFSLCHTGGGGNCVVDGDTLWINGEKVRVADIDAPETHPPRCAREADLGRRATYRLHDLVNAGPFAIFPVARESGRYGRKLRVLSRSGRSLGDMLVSEGLARTWSGRREPWC